MDRSGDTGPNAPEHDGQESEPSPRLRLEVVIETDDWGASEALELLVEGVARILAEEPGLAPMLGAGASACVAFTGDAQVRALNARYRSKDKPTNVLSFPAARLPSGLAANGEPLHLGDVVLAAETVAAEARDLGIPMADHVQHLVVHGVLHLVGHDHEADVEAEAMEALETRLLARLGIADPYRSND